VEFLEEFKMKRGWYLDDFLQIPVKAKISLTELKKECRVAHKDLAARIRDYSPSIVVSLLLRIREDVETAVLMANSDACVYAVPFPLSSDVRSGRKCAFCVQGLNGCLNQLAHYPAYTAQPVGIGG
jgi:hypothetical protein